MNIYFSLFFQEQVGIKVYLRLLKEFFLPEALSI